MSDLFSRTTTLVRALQAEICAALERVDGSGRFRSVAWERPGGGGGDTRVLAGGTVFEKAGVNTSVVEGVLPETLTAELPGEATTFRATGVSLVLHPRSPMVPTVHANFRRIERGDRGWFGGGADLTPHYVFDEDAAHFHRVWRDACGRHPTVASYPAMKKACDDYFFIPHRNEHRGIGGIFFDHLEDDPDATFAFVADAGRAFLDAYLPIVARRREHPWGEREREHQLVRRGRYVEFNLVYDRGTVFGLRTGGNIESILMSLPDPARWVFDAAPEPGSWEARSIEALVPRDWIPDPS